MHANKMEELDEIRGNAEAAIEIKKIADEEKLTGKKRMHLPEAQLVKGLEKKKMAFDGEFDKIDDDLKV